MGYAAAIEDDPIAAAVMIGAMSHVDAARIALRYARTGERIETHGPRGGIRVWTACGPEWEGRPTQLRSVST